jgi:hypothetical protein
MTANTSEQIRAIIQWRDEHYKMLYTDYPQQFIACGTNELLASGKDFETVRATAEATGKPFIIDWIPALTQAEQFE